MISNSTPGKARTLAAIAWLALAALPAAGEQCSNATEMEPGTRAALELAATQFFTYLAHNDSASLRQHATAALTSSFAAVEAMVAGSQPALGGAQAATRATYLLETGGSGVLPHAEFLCGIWGTPQFVSFEIPNLPAGRYGLVIEDAKGPKGAYYVTFVLQQEQANRDWRLAGLPAPAPAQVMGHDAGWFLSQARAFQAEGQSHNAWFYYQEARALADPLPFMSTTPVLKLAREMQAAAPADLPVNGPVPLVAPDGKSYSLTQAFPIPGEDGLELVVKYASPDISDTARDFQDNVAVITAITAKFPELRRSFNGVVARAVGPDGKDYGTLLAMKDIK